jgi:serine/threonine-protein kinase
MPDEGSKSLLDVLVAGGRYRLEGEIGRGGMATIHAAIDQATGNRVAFKRLIAREDDDSSRRSREYFECEYHTLVQLAHPRIVSAYDYGLDGELPYYTMELLDGGDLLERSPLPWREACAVARDVCSALSLVHSRRMVYRDLSPRNVRCTSNGKAKLIDFGAMAPVGPAPLAVCTPAVASPEVVYRLPLDGRSDLYALGAMLYFTLVGRNAYPARTFHQLLALWQQPPSPPSEIDPSIPAALDALVMDLLQLDPQLRPASAAEVSERLSAIAGVESDEQLLVARAYLTTPTLVGRERELRKVGGALERLKERGKGAAMLVRAAPGVGRSRFLDACALSAKLAGLTVVRTLTGDASDEPGAYARAIVQQLLAAASDEALQAALPEGLTIAALRSALDQGEGADAPLVSDAPALRQLVVAVAKHSPLLIAVDDFERLDTGGRALVALLAHEASGHPLLVVATTACDRNAENDATRLLTGGWTELPLRALDGEQTRTLLTSIFGDVPNMEALVQRLHAVSAGNPQALMLLAQHLLDRSIVRFEAGTWVLPETIDAGELPETLAQAFRVAAQSLSEDARGLGRAFARCADQSFTAEECVALTEHGDWPRTFRSLDQLLKASVLAMSGNAYRLSVKSWIEPLLGERDHALERRFARVFDARGDGLRAAQHLFRIGEDAEGLDTLLAFSRSSYIVTGASSEAYVRLLADLPHDWRALFDKGSALCTSLGRPIADWYALQVRVVSFFSQNDVCSNGQLLAVAQRIAQDAGLDLYAQLDPTLPAGVRLQQALGATAARYAQTPSHERMLDPQAAIGALARGLITYIGNYSRALDAVEWRKVPSLSPLVPLSPSIAVVDSLARGFDARITGRFERAREIYAETLELIDGNDGAGLDRTFVESVRAGIMSIIGMMEAGLGLASAEQHADDVAAFPLYQGSALAIRMVQRLWLGDIAGATELARKSELARLEQSRAQTGDAMATLWALQAHAASDDLTHTRQYLEAVERLASRMHTWQPVAAWARGEYERIRGDFDAALASADAALALLPEGEHHIWAFAASLRARLLCEQGRWAEAREASERYVAIAEAHGLGYGTNYIRMPLAVAAAKLGDAETAWLNVRKIVEVFEAVGARGINIGFAYDTAARVAAMLGDQSELERYAALCKENFHQFPNAALAAKYQRLYRATRLHRTRAEVDPSQSSDSVSSMARSQMESLLQTCKGSEERLQCALQLLVSSTGAEGGVLYGLREGSITLRAKTDVRSLPPEVEAEALRYLQTELGSGATESDTADPGEGSSIDAAWTSVDGRCYRPMLLNHVGPEGFFATGLVVLASESARKLRIPGETMAFLSRTMVQSGDLQAVLIAS